MQRKLALQTLSKHGDDAVEYLHHTVGDCECWGKPAYNRLESGTYEPDLWRLSPEFFRGKELSLEEAEQFRVQGEKVIMVCSEGRRGIFIPKLAPKEQPKPCYVEE